jgi:phosphoglycolate phosphatase
MALLLFDIDGTLIRPMGIGRRAFEKALLERYGRVPEQRFPYDGMLDPQIAARTLGLLGVEPTSEEVDALLARYVELLAEERPSDVRAGLCAGLPDLLEMATARGHHIGLLTGNVHDGAKLKLSFFGLDRYFENGLGLLGAFGGDAGTRAELVPVASERCSCAFGRAFPLEETWLVGDSPRDVEAARGSGARCVAVATGWCALEDLAALGPDLALPDLGVAAPFWCAVEGTAP